MTGGSKKPGMAQEACTAWAGVAVGAPARPNTVRLPLSSWTATIHNGAAGQRLPYRASKG